ncbi:MAG: hypothetical protein Q9164_003270 [Protoblastenia rupestris]
MTRLPPIANLMSPPEAKPLDSFSLTPSKSPSTSQQRGFTPEDRLAPMGNRHTPETKLRILPSPPISPWQDRSYRQEKHTQPNGSDHGRKESDNKDPVLYAESDPGSTYEEPLFPFEPVASTEDLITKHMAMHLNQFKNKLNQPTREEYRLALACVPTIGAQYNRNPGAYLKRQREEQENEYWQVKRLCAQPGTKAAPIAIAPAPKPGKRAIKAMTPKPAIPRVKRTPKASPMARLMDYPPKGRSETPDRALGVKRDDVDYNALSDYAPSTATLPNNPKILKADWPSNNILNLSNDPDRHMLHEAEVNLAATLRLTCATYLCSKRRIFEARLNALRIGKEFRKTDAQQACKIDVNKASKLWTAYDKVGWFSPGYFEKFL